MKRSLRYLSIIHVVVLTTILCERIGLAEGAGILADFPYFFGLMAMAGLAFMLVLYFRPHHDAVTWIAFILSFLNLLALIIYFCGPFIAIG